MALAFRCKRCGTSHSVPEQLAGRKARCDACGLVGRIPTPMEWKSKPVRVPEPGGYPLVEVAPSPLPMIGAGPVRSENHDSSRGVVVPAKESRSKSVRKPSHSEAPWRRLLREYTGETSRLEQEILLLVALSAADLLVTYALLRQGPSFYESNPFAQWVFQRWNIAGMTLFKFGVIGGVVLVGEVAERRRPGLGRSLMAVSCLATAAVVVYGLKLLTGFAAAVDV